MATKISIVIGSSNEWLPDGAKSLHVAVLTWPIAGDVPWQSSQSNLTKYAHEYKPHPVFRDGTFAITTAFRRVDRMRKFKSSLIKNMQPMASYN